MTKKHKSELKGFCLPDYDGGSILNLMASIIRSRGGRSPHRELRGLPARRLARARKIVYLVVDGLGEGQLRQFLAGGRGRAFFAVHPHDIITTVFPPTTAAAVTTFSTGASPAEHGILGWHLHLPDLGMVSTILPAVTRTGSPMVGENFNLREYLDFPLHLASARGMKALFSYGQIPWSRYSLAGMKWTSRAAFMTLKGMQRRVMAFVRKPGRGLAYAYWPGYDSACHARGCYHRQTIRHLAAIDGLLGNLARGIRGMGTTLIVVSDHGLMDTAPGCAVELRNVPGFYDCLTVLPSGDARQVQCFVRPSKVKDFLAITRRALAKACVCISGQELMKSGALGPGKLHRALAGRVGDYVLLARPGYSFAYSPAGFDSEFNVANHGGVSIDEMRVPLYVIPG